MRSVLASLAALAGTAAAQVVPVVPYPRTFDLLVVDSTNDCVWRLADVNQDGDTNDPGEVVSFYSDTLGGLPLTTPTCVVAAPDGTVYVGDSNLDVVLALNDRNGDGDANDPAEQRVFFDSATNASGVTMASVMGITVDAIGRLFLAVSNSGTTGTDLILLLHDADGDGDAGEAGEARSYCTIPGGSGATGNSVPTKVVVGPDTNVYYTDIASTGSLVKGVYRASDLNQNGHCNDAGEVTLFWSPPATASPFYFGLAVDWQGWFYVTDNSANEQVWRARDTDGNGAIDASEDDVFYQSTGSTWWDVVLREDGAVLLCDADAPDRVTLLRDLDQNGNANGAGEATDLYHSGLAAVAVAPRGASLLRAPLLSVTPPVVAIGQSTTLQTWATEPGDLTLLLISVGLATPFALPPFGTVEVDASAFASVALGFADANGFFTVPFAVPNVATAIGTWAFQSLSGDQLRLFLSNPVLLTVTP